MPHRSERECHIASLLVQVLEEAKADVSMTIGAIAGAEIHAPDSSGKLIVTLEAPSLGDVSDALNAISVMKGVISATLVYHHVEDAARLEELVELAEPLDDCDTVQKVLS